jgi:hypothetical protein
MSSEISSRISYIMYDGVSKRAAFHTPGFRGRPPRAQQPRADAAAQRKLYKFST